MKGAGPCPVLMQAVKARLEASDPMDRFATLGFDGMALTEALRFHEHLDQVVGYEDLGSLGRTKKVANQGLAAVLRGVRGTWKLPIGYLLPYRR